MMLMTKNSPTIEDSKIVDQQLVTAQTTSLQNAPQVHHPSQTTPLRLPLRPSQTKCLICRYNPTCRLPSHIAYSRRLQAARPSSISRLVLLSSISPLKTQLVNPRMDPFARYPISMSPEEHLLLDLWAQPWGVDSSLGPERHQFPKPSTMLERLLPFAMQSPLILHSALAMIATQRSLSTGKIDAEAYSQQSKVSRVHMRANRDPVQANSDENIVAGLAVMSNYMADGKIEEGMRLLDGINGIVKGRGGPHYLGMQGLVSRYLLMSDHMQAVIRCCKPTWDMPLPSLQFRSEPPLMLGYGFQQLPDPRLRAAATDLCRAIQLFELGCRGPMNNEQLGAFEYLSGISEYQLGLLHSEYYQVSPRNSCICLALLIFNHVILRNAGAIAPAVRLMEGRFWKEFSDADVKGLWDNEDNYLLIWMILTPLLIAIRAPCLSINPAIDRLRIVQRRVGIHGWENLKVQVLQKYIWFGMAQSKLLHDIWESVETLSSVVSGG